MDLTSIDTRCVNISPQNRLRSEATLPPFEARSILPPLRGLQDHAHPCCHSRSRPHSSQHERGNVAVRFRGYVLLQLVPGWCTMREADILFYIKICILALWGELSTLYQIAPFSRWNAVEGRALPLSHHVLHEVEFSICKSLSFSSPGIKLERRI